jgi:hypothetical protein
VVGAADAGAVAGRAVAPVTGAAASMVAAGRVDRLQQAT